LPESGWLTYRPFHSALTMTPPSPASTPFWQPFTPRGVARAASAPRWQLWIALGLTAGLSVASVLFFLNRCWQPVIVAAIDQLADGGQIRQGILQPGGASTDVTLASNRYLAITLNWTEAGPRDQVADVRLILQIDRFLVCSLFGCTAFSYEGIGDRPVGRTETGAWWRAWQPFLFTAIALGHALYLIIAWWLLTIVYAWAIRLLAFYLDRELDFTGATRVAQAALIPGALWLTATVFLHAAGWLDMLGLLIVLVMHVPVGWLYAGLACRSLPLRPDVLPPNPFQAAEPVAGPEPENPFRARGG
jgi:hypothetical protein